MTKTVTPVVPVAAATIAATATQKIQEVFAPIFGLMQDGDFSRKVEFAETYRIPEVERTEDGCGLVIKHLPADYTRDLLETSPIMGICHQLKHLYTDGDRIGKTGIKQKKKTGHRLENNNLRMCFTYTSTVRRTSDAESEMTIKFYIDQSGNARAKESFNRADVSDDMLKEFKKSGRLFCHNRSKVIVWRDLTEQEQQDLLGVIITTCVEETKEYIQEAYHSAYLCETAPNYLVTTPPRHGNLNL